MYSPFRVGSSPKNTFCWESPEVSGFRRCHKLFYIPYIATYLGTTPLCTHPTIFRLGPICVPVGIRLGFLTPADWLGSKTQNTTGITCRIQRGWALLGTIGNSNHFPTRIPIRRYMLVITSISQPGFWLGTYPSWDLKGK
jgi:hypothetical protein